jgi:hypothetical protein
MARRNNNHRIKGIILVGKIDNAGVLLSLIQRKIDVSSFEEELLSDRFNFGKLLIPGCLELFLLVLPLLLELSDSALALFGKFGVIISDLNLKDRIPVFLDRNEIVYIDKVETDQNRSGLKMASRIGGRNPAHSCAVGKVLLSHLSDEELSNIVREKGLPKRTENTITDPSLLKEHLIMVKKQGYAIDDEENEKGIRCVAAPILNEVGKPVAAISISGPAFRVTKKVVQETLKKEVMETALRISQTLGLAGTNSGTLFK